MEINSMHCLFCGQVPTSSTDFKDARTGRLVCYCAVEPCHTAGEALRHAQHDERRRQLAAANRCSFEEAWIGFCGQPGTPYCAKHASQRCWSCGVQATRNCSWASSLVCGVPECDAHSHRVAHPREEG